jgi:hypothetical protein
MSLKTNDAIRHWKSKGLDYSNILFKPELKKNVAVRCVQPQDFGRLHSFHDTLPPSLIYMSPPQIIMDSTPPTNRM